MTIGQLKEIIKNIPDDTRIVVNYPGCDNDGEADGSKVEGNVDCTHYFGRQNEFDIEVELPPRYYWLHR